MKKEDNENSDIKEIKSILSGFISEQRSFNQAQLEFNREQLEFNNRIEKKIDKVQYFLEETIAENSKMFFEEQMDLKVHVRELDGEVELLKGQVSDLSSRVNLLFK